MQQICDISKEKIVYVDETGIDTYLHRQHCYAKKGEKVVGYVYGKKYSRIGIVVAQIEKLKKYLNNFSKFDDALHYCFNCN